MSWKVETDQRGSSDSDFRMLEESFARWKTKSSSQLSEGAVVLYIKNKENE